MNKETCNPNNLTLFKGYVCRKQREKQHGHKGAVIWFTGLSASGKSTLAHILEKELHDQRCSTYVLDGDNIRYGLCGDLGFCDKDRNENMRRVGELVKLFVDAGIIVISAFISPYKQDREAIRRLFKPKEFMEIYLQCPLAVCARRDKKGLYARAMKAEIPNFTGVSAPYEAPENPDLKICTDKLGAMQAASQIVRLIERNGIIPQLPRPKHNSFGWYKDLRTEEYKYYTPEKTPIERNIMKQY